MNIYELRQAITVSHYTSSRMGCTVYYKILNRDTYLTLDYNLFITELTAIGSIDESFGDKYVLSQWDALNIAIRFELAREQQKQIDNSDIGKAINKITNKQP